MMNRGKISNSIYKKALAFFFRSNDVFCNDDDDDVKFIKIFY